MTNVGDAFNVQPFTVLGWEVGDIQAEVTELVERGVGFLRVAIAATGRLGSLAAPDGTQVAWFKDPDGNALSLSQRTHRSAAAASQGRRDR